MHLSPGLLPSMHPSWTRHDAIAVKVECGMQEPTHKLSSLLLVHSEHEVHLMSYRLSAADERIHNAPQTSAASS